MTARPNLFLVGAPKCGTTALAQYLSEREDVFFCAPKEPFFLADDIPGLREMTFLPDEAAYLKLFEGADPARHAIVAEGSTAYLRSTRAIPAALAMSPEARFIAMLRDPVKIAHGYHMEQIYDRNEDIEDFETAWRLQDARAAGQAISPHARIPAFLQYHETACIGDQLERFFEAVPAERRLVLLQEDLLTAPRETWTKVLAFLGLPDDGRSEFPPVNPSRKHRFPWLANLVLDPPGPLKRPVYALRSWMVRTRPPIIEKIKASLRKEQAREALSPEFEAELRVLFLPEVEKVEALLGRDLSAWKPGAAQPGSQAAG
ncbi:sulfotransferase [uncultured Albimonas sp.]|jgi:hypothetical protein|uniref:sulfotransferase family protein n=1 Tax=uncultured Albimonas sp. TaxID=1331701 RepID=UPI0030ED5E18|tara:strand:- start:278 stop:1228 length:951 start_codon:yes stop_codon:yes gene_type:complete